MSAAAPAEAPAVPYQQEGMQDEESFVGMLRAQADALYPQELPHFRRQVAELEAASKGARPARVRVLEVGAGSGEVALRLAREFPNIELVAIELEARWVALANRRLAAESADVRARVRFEQGDAFRLSRVADGAFHLAYARSMLHAIGSPEKVVAELLRALAPGGRLHLLNEDYGMLVQHPTRLDSSSFWADTALPFFKAGGANGAFGRESFALVHGLFGAQLAALDAHVLTATTSNTPRRALADIIHNWKVGYTTALAQHSKLSAQRIAEHFDDIGACVLSPGGFFAWSVVLITATKKG
jgi:SAM-dependent methyltransferase